MFHACSKGCTCIMKRFICTILLCSFLFAPLSQNAQAASQTSSATIISAALSQLEHEEGEKGYTKYGQWYGIPYGHWCDMFVSWCATQAALPKSIFPRSAGCTTHVRMFNKIGRYQVSAARGGSYVPQPGDVIFFYDYDQYPAANVVRHVGVVLCVENGNVFTIEGNTLTPRLDYSKSGKSVPGKYEYLQPKDYVAIKYYPLNSRQIHGYGVPDYTVRESLAHYGFVDLGKYEPLRAAFTSLSFGGVMPGTSSYTFSPRYGMTRGDFVQMLMKLYSLSGWETTTKPFADVPEGSAYFNAAMAARSAGIVNGVGGNNFNPDAYISGNEVQTLISRTLAYLGQADQQFSFSQGDFSYPLAPYTIRADIAKAVYALYTSKRLSATTPSEKLLLNGELLNWPMLNLNYSTYVPLESLKQAFPDLTLSVAGKPQTSANGPLPVPMCNAGSLLMTKVTLQCGENTAEVPSFYCQGKRYVMLRPAAGVLNVEVQWMAEDGTIELIHELPEASADLGDLPEETPVQPVEEQPAEEQPAEEQPVEEEPVEKPVQPVEDPEASELAA